MIVARQQLINRAYHLMMQEGVSTKVERERCLSEVQSIKAKLGIKRLKDLLPTEQRLGRQSIGLKN